MELEKKAQDKVGWRMLVGGLCSIGSNRNNSSVCNLEDNTKTVVLYQNSLWDGTALKENVLSSTVMNQESTLGGQTVLVADSDDDQ
ncbi:unnamed protein product [Schistosoma curassoni]|uniref:Phosducin domain-containing protein n=1 Tax=Schistosoma curassoni TaxID=6186 RepID=A0A183KGA9_9TREM|nr:unnamed protein product [Schistosoma curassoni]